MHHKTKYFRPQIAAPAAHYLLTCAGCGGVSNDLRDQIVEGLGQASHCGSAAISNVKKAIEQWHVEGSPSATNVGWMSSFHDYVAGAALALNPLPHVTVGTFATSDAAALHSDWVTTRTDLQNVWVMVSLVNDLLIQVESIEATNDGHSEWGRPSAVPAASETSSRKNRAAT